MSKMMPIEKCARVKDADGTIYLIRASASKNPDGTWMPKARVKIDAANTGFSYLDVPLAKKSSHESESLAVSEARGAAYQWLITTHGIAGTNPEWDVPCPRDDDE
jgi:hypothetical protein